MSGIPLVSIILPTYNGSRYLQEAIQSCIDQTYRNWELIIVDDASTDETPQIIKRWLNGDSRIIAIRHTQNKKLPVALNTGFANAKGKYFTWISDDNLYRPEALTTMVSFLENHHEVGVVYTDYTRLDEQNHELERITVQEPEELIYMNPVGASFLYRREVHETNHGYNEHLFLVEDYDFWIRASLSFALKPLHEALYYYRSHGKSLTNTRTMEIKSLHEKLVVNYISLMTWIPKRKRSEALLGIAYISGKQGLKKKAFSYLYRALRLSRSIHAMKTSIEIMIYVLLGHKMAQATFSQYRKMKIMLGK